MDLEYLSPTSLTDALSLLGSCSPSIIAGGTDWYPAQGEVPITCDMLDLTRIDGLRAIERRAIGWRIGAASTWSDLIAADLPAAFDALKAAAREVGSFQIQNAGTLVGNLCNASPAADGVPPLLCLNASVEISSAQGARVVALQDFITGVRRTSLDAGELVSAILIPDVADTQKSAFQKLGARKYLVISIAMVAVSCTIEDGAFSDVRIAVGSCSPVAQRLTALEVALDGCDIAALEPIVKQADFSALSPINDVRGSGEYRLDVVASLILRALKEVAHG